MAKKHKEVKFYSQAFRTAGRIINDGETIKMEDGSVFKRTVIPSLFGNDNPINSDVPDLEDIDQGSPMSELDLDALD